MAALPLAFLVLLAILLIVRVEAEYRVSRTTDWEALDRWLLVQAAAGPAAVFAAGAACGSALAWGAA